MCDLRDRGILYPSSIAQAAAEREASARRAHAFLDELRPVIDGDQWTALDNAITDMVGAIEMEITARLVEALVAVNHADVSVFAAPLPVRGRVS